MQIARKQLANPASGTTGKKNVLKQSLLISHLTPRDTNSFTEQCRVVRAKVHGEKLLFHQWGVHGRRDD